MELRAVEVQPLVTTDLIAAVQRPMTTTAIAATTVYANAEVLRRVLAQLVDSAAPPAALAVIAAPRSLTRSANRGSTRTGARASRTAAPRAKRSAGGAGSRTTRRPARSI